jgi:hypothetical protein
MGGCRLRSVLGGCYARSAKGGGGNGAVRKRESRKSGVRGCNILEKGLRNFFSETIFQNFTLHFPVNGNDFLLTNILQRNKHMQMLKTFSGKYFTTKQTEPNSKKKGGGGGGTHILYILFAIASTLGDVTGAMSPCSCSPLIGKLPMITKGATPGELAKGETLCWPITSAEWFEEVYRLHHPMNKESVEPAKMGHTRSFIVNDKGKEV